MTEKQAQQFGNFYRKAKAEGLTDEQILHLILFTIGQDDPQAQK